jgi:ATP-binding cassette subfamily E protein 1
LTFRIAETADEFAIDKSRAFTYPKMEKTLGSFKLNIDAGDFTDSEIIVMMGENGTGKTTFCRLLAGALKPDSKSNVPEMRISMKPQTITPKFEGTVRQLFFKKIKQAFLSPQFQTDVVKPLKLEDFIDQEVKNLSGGELQRVAIVLALGIPADIYLIDEPSAYLDSEQRIIASRVIKRFIMHSKKTAFIVEHDFIMATYLADRVIVFDGQPGIDAHANKPQSLLTGCNAFLKNLDVTFRRDPTNYRPRINKNGSQLDQEQKMSGNFVSLLSTNIPSYNHLLTYLYSSSWRRTLLKRAKGAYNENFPSLDGASPGVWGVQNGNGQRLRILGIDDDRSAGEDDDPDG